MISVELIDHMGSDLSVVNAARVSFHKQSDWEFISLDDIEEVEEAEKTLQGKADWDYIYSDRWMGGYPVEYLSDKDKKLIHYLAKHKHISPFGHCFASFRVKAPVFVARQLVKHAYLRWNEVSRRYVDDPPSFFIPDRWRTKADNVKQGSGEGEVSTIPYGGFRSEPVNSAVDRLYHHASELYQTLLDEGVCPEQARMVLPQAMLTEWIWSGSLDAFTSMCRLRLDPHTQKESREVAGQVSSYMSDLFPVSWEALLAQG